MTLKIMVLLDLPIIKLEKICTNKFYLLLLWKLKQAYGHHKTPSAAKSQIFQINLFISILQILQRLRLIEK